MRRLEEHITIQASAENVWNVLRDFGGADSWAPYVRRSTLIGEGASGVGSRRALRHASGVRLEECVVAWSEGQGYSFDVVKAPYPMRDVREDWTVNSTNRDLTVTTTVKYGMRLGMVGRLLDRFLVRHLVRREMRAGLRGLKRYVEVCGTKV